VDLHLLVEGDVVERQELLNGTVVLTFEGASMDGAWRFSATASWNAGITASAPEGDLTLARADGAEVLATVTEVTPHQSEEEGSLELELTYVVDDVAGVEIGHDIAATLTVTNDRFAGEVRLTEERA
jgi:hypothetical protein